MKNMVFGSIFLLLVLSAVACSDDTDVITLPWSSAASSSSTAVSSSSSSSSLSSQATAVTLTGVTQSGGVSNSTTTSALTLSFSIDPTTLTADNITVTGATKGALSGTGTTRTLEISDITVANGATVSVAITNPTGFLLSGSPKTAVVYKAPTPVVFTGLTANGASYTTLTTTLTLTFDVNPTSLAASHITVTGATRGTLSGTGLTRTLTISSITVANGETISVSIANPNGFAISGSPKTVVVYKPVGFTGLSANGTSGSVTTTELTLTFDADPAALAASDITVTGATKGDLSGTGLTRKLAISAITVVNGANVTVTVANPAGYSITPSSKTVAVNVSFADLEKREMVSVPGGTFTQTMTANGGPFEHTISAFKMGKYEVTYELWYTVRTWAIANGYVFANAGREGNDGTIGAAPTSAKYEPVTGINWRDVIVWCNAYSQRDGKTPVYYSDANGSFQIKSSLDGSYGSSISATAGSYDNPYIGANANGYRLPTEGEWQYAASYKDGSSWTPYTWASGATADHLDVTATGLVAWYVFTSSTSTKPVGTKAANQLGIHDMSGNVYEWVLDYAYILPTSGSYIDLVALEVGTRRIIRGGAFDATDHEGLEVGWRGSIEPYQEYVDLGFRVASRP